MVNLWLLGKSSSLAIFDFLFSIWQTILSTLVHFWLFGKSSLLCMAKILNKQCSHLVTLFASRNVASSHTTSTTSRFFISHCHLKSLRQINVTKNMMIVLVIKDPRQAKRKINSTFHSSRGRTHKKCFC